VRILVFGHVSDTGFGVVTERLSERFIRAGHDVRVIAVNHRGEPIRGPLAGRVWPAAIAGQPYGGNVSTGAIDGSFWTSLDRSDDWQPERVLVIADMSGLFGHLPPTGINAAWKSVPVFHYCPIEGDNLPLGWREVWKHFTPVAMSDYGARVIGEFTGRPVSRIYHGVDTEHFRPVSMNEPLRYGSHTLRTKEDAKAAFNIKPDRLVVLRTDRNVERKFYDRLFSAMVPVFDAVPAVDLVIHCRPVDEGRSLWDEIGRLPARHLNPPRIILTNAHDTWRGLPVEGLAALLNAADLYVSTTGGEGFGLTLAESLACEVPVVVTDWAAEREVVGPGGMLVPPLHDSYGEPVRYHSSYGMDWAVPDPRGFVKPIVDLLTHPSRRRALGRAGRHHVRRSFSWDEAAVAFLTLFEDARVADLAA
jgi:glycosyltransferase involved in cell wall biosynthesis